jgi:hypothetical protein
MMNKTNSEFVAAPLIAMAASEDRSMLKGISILSLLHDLLPWDEDQPGLTPRCLQTKLQRMGIPREMRALQRDLEDLVEVAWVETEGQRPRRYRRYYPQSLVYRLTGKHAAGVPDWPSEIVFRNGDDENF